MKEDRVQHQTYEPMEGPGGIRTITARWVVEGALRLLTAASIGGGTGEVTDVAILRDHRGTPFLPGTSLAGALRTHLADRLGGFGSAEHEKVAALFGVAKRRKGGAGDTGHQSPLVIHDARPSSPAETEIRDGVKIVAATGIAETRKKFDAELLVPGTTFDLRFELVLGQRHDEGEMLALLEAALSGLGDGSISFGARRSRGLGRVQAESWRARRFDLTTREGWMEWLTTIPDERLGADASAWPPAGAERLGDERQRFIVDAALEVNGSILIGTPSTTAAGPDVVHLTSGGNSTLSGTSLAGALRNRALRIARAVRNGQGDADRWVDRLFGPSFEGTKRSSVEPRASRLRVSEAPITSDRRLQGVRIAIDRFTQAPVDSALVEEEASYGGAVRNVRLEIRRPNDGEAGLLLLVLKDLLTGDLPLGGTAAVGRGVVHGTATVTAGGSRWSLPPEPADVADTVAMFNDLVNELHRQPKLMEVAHGSK